MDSETLPDLSADRSARIEAALEGALDMARGPALPAPLAGVVARLQQDHTEQRWDAAALSLRHAAQMLAHMAADHPWPALLPAFAWLLRRMEQFGPVCLEPAIGRALIEGLAQGVAAEGTATALGRIQARQAFREAVWAEGLRRVPLVPLGFNCVPWNMPARWGLRSGADAMRCFNPFALAAHHPDAVLDVLEQGWTTYAPPGRIRAMATPAGQRLMMRDDGKAIWSHHTGEAWAAGDFAALKLDLAIMAGRFQSVMNHPRHPHVVFLLGEIGTTPPEAMQQVAQRLLGALRRRLRRAAAHLVVLQTPQVGEALPPTPLGPGAVLLRVPQPAADYAWHLPATFDTPAGYAFEAACMTALRDVVRPLVPAGPGA
jgi:hypothetical protein